MRGHRHRGIFAILELEFINLGEDLIAFYLVQSLIDGPHESMVRDRHNVILTSLFLIPLFDCPPPPPRTSSFDETNADEYIGKACNEWEVCCTRIRRTWIGQ